MSGKKGKTWVSTVWRHGVAATLMESSDKNDLPQKYETNLNPEHVLAFKKILYSLSKKCTIFSKRTENF